MLYLSFFRISFHPLFQEQDRTRHRPLRCSDDRAERAALRLHGLHLVDPLPFLAGIAAGFIELDRFTDRLRSIFGVLFIGLTSIAWVFTFVYFKEYNEQFNYFIFNLYYDDTKAIMQTIWADYHPIPVLIVIGVLSAIAFSVSTIRPAETAPCRRRRSRPVDFPLVSRMLISLLILALLIVASRGSIGRRPAQRKDAAITEGRLPEQGRGEPLFLAALRGTGPCPADRPGGTGIISAGPGREKGRAGTVQRSSIIRQPRCLSGKACEGTEDRAAAPHFPRCHGELRCLAVHQEVRLPRPDGKSLPSRRRTAFTSRTSFLPRTAPCSRSPRS